MEHDLKETTDAIIKEYKGFLPVLEKKYSKKTKKTIGSSSLENIRTGESFTSLDVFQGPSQGKKNVGWVFKSIKTSASGLVRSSSRTSTLSKSPSETQEPDSPENEQDTPLQGSKIKSLSETNIFERKKILSLYDALTDRKLFEPCINLSFTNQTHENVFFFMSVLIFKEKYLKMKSDQISDSIDYIINLYLKNGSPLELNIDHQLKIDTLMKEHNEKMFDELLDTVNWMMEGTLLKIK